MQTITFYSYKGGVGRTLAVANIARYLARLGQSVFAMDFDLESPGLHYKLAPARVPDISFGVVDYIYSFAVQGETPSDLGQFVLEVAAAGSTEGSEGSIHLMPAGHVPSTSYWRRLAHINWHGLFYSDDAPGGDPSAPPTGVHHFLELKAQIEAQYRPNFLLIDSRTGITEIGGVATTVLPDTVVCLLVNNQENLEGARAVLRSIAAAERLPGQQAVRIVPVLARIPQTKGGDVEQSIASEVRAFLSEQAEELAETLEVPEVLLLHSEPELELSESLRVGGDKGPDESPLLADYLRLFGRLIPKQVVEPRVDSLVRQALSTVLDDPDGAQKALEELASYTEHPHAYTELLRFYRLRNMGIDRQILTAQHAWQTSGDAVHPLFLGVVSKYLDYEARAFTRPDRDDERISSGFLLDVWRGPGAKDAGLGLRIADWCARSRRVGDLRRVLSELFESVGYGEATVLAALRSLRIAGDWQVASELVERCKPEFASNPQFQTAWARTVLAQDELEAVAALVSDTLFRLDVVQREDPITALELLERTGAEEAEPFLRSVLVGAAHQGEYREMEKLARLYRRLGRSDQLVATVREALPEDQARRATAYLQRAVRTVSRYPAPEAVPG